jgi:hypothetical protein
MANINAAELLKMKENMNTFLDISVCLKHQQKYLFFFLLLFYSTRLFLSEFINTTSVNGVMTYLSMMAASMFYFFFR